MNQIYTLHLTGEELKFLIELVGQLPTRLGGHAMYTKLVNSAGQQKTKQTDEGQTNDGEPKEGVDTAIRPS